MTTRCEVCAGAQESWRLDSRNVVSRCSSCGHVERDLSQAPAGARSPAYGGDPAMDRWRLAVTYRRLRRLVPARGARVFEVGFGTGDLLRRFFDDGAVVAGADPGSLEVALDPVVADRGTLHRASLEDLRQPGQHDLVFGVHVVEHVSDAGGFARACRDIVRPGGRVVLVTPAGDSASIATFRSRWWMFEDPTHVRFFSARSVTRLLEDSGFVDVRVRRLVLDSLGVEAASCVRWLMWGHLPPAGVLTLRRTRVLVLLVAPVVGLLRLVRPKTRPVLEVVARRPDGPA